ncbi:hypothetical protein ACQP1O_17310 [Nocardia sp. CA-151230]|uniref:hypothetical protein n=1 Tax=Nocardia sp. CA-151230 TaxID=3239982 RepID=UPI003D8F2C80
MIAGPGRGAGPDGPGARGVVRVSPTGTGTVNVTVTAELDGTSTALPYAYL